MRCHKMKHSVGSKQKEGSTFLKGMCLYFAVYCHGMLLPTLDGFSN